MEPTIKIKLLALFPECIDAMPGNCMGPIHSPAFPSVRQIYKNAGILFSCISGKIVIIAYFVSGFFLFSCVGPRSSPRIFPTPQPRLFPIELARGPIEYMSPQLAAAEIGDSFRAVVVWGQSDHIYARTFQSSSHGPVDCCWLGDSDLGVGIDPDVAMDNNGRSIAVWRNQNITAGRRLVSGREWGLLETIADNTVLRPTAPVIAMTPLGDAFVVWISHDQVLTKQFRPSFGWGVETRINPNGSAADNLPLDVAMDPLGNAVAVWTNFNRNQSLIHANRFTPGQGWNVPVPIEPSIRQSIYCKVAMDANGNAVAVWNRLTPTTVLSAFANRGLANGSWESPTRLPFNSADTGQETRKPQIAMDGAGNAFALWTQTQAGRKYRIQSRQYILGQGWGDPLVLSSSASNAFSPQVTANSAGLVVAVWVEQVNGETRLLVNFFRPPTGWQPQPTLVKAIANQTIEEPRVALSPSGTALVIWTEMDAAMQTNNSLNAVFLR